MDKVSKDKRSEIMRLVKSKETKLEQLFRQKLWNAGLRYTKHNENQFGKPDLMLKRKRIAIFIDSCFWHGCPEHLRVPASNRKYWISKIEGNKNRDKEVNAHYRKSGWRVIRVWEHQISKQLEEVVNRIFKVVDNSFKK